MKKFLSLVLALIMTMSLVTISAGATEYADLSDKDEIQYEEAVAVLNRIGVITGYEDGSFRPETELTRGAAAKIIVSLLIGPEAASNLPNTYAPYPDVPANHTFAGVISYCKTAGIISGYGDGTFKPANSLTGYAFAKMLLGAIGYDSKIQGYTDTGWTMNVARDGNIAGLFNRIEFDGAAAVNREQACQLALNTLKATMVEYSGGLNVTAGDAHVTSNPTLTYKISNQEYARHINEKRAGGLNTIYGNLNVEGHYTVEFGEEHFKDLRMKAERDNPDQFGRPSNEWSFKKVTIGTFPIEPDFIYTTQVIHNDDVKVTDAAKVRALNLAGYELTEDDWKTGEPVDTTLWLNGEKFTGAALADAKNNTDAKNPNHHLQTVGDIADYTDNGTAVEVYVDEEDADFIRDVVVVKTQLMEVKSLKSEAVALKLYDDGADDSHKYMGFNSTPINEDVNDVQINDDCYDTLKDKKVGDIVAVIPVWTGINSKYDVAEVYTPETVSGELTNVDTYGQSTADGELEAAVTTTVGGTDYKVALWNKKLVDIDGTKIRVTRKDVTLYLDEYGNAMYAKDVGSTSNFMVIGGYHSGLVDGKVVTFVDGWDIKGNEISLNVGNINYDWNAIKNNNSPYAIGNLVHYSSDTHSKYAEWDLDYLGVFDVASKRPTDDGTEAKNYSLKASSSRVQLNGWTAAGDGKTGAVDTTKFYKGNDDALNAAGDAGTGVPTPADTNLPFAGVTQNVYVDDSGIKVIYVTMDSDDNEVDSIEIKDGMQAITYEEIMGFGSTFAHQRAQACVNLKKDNTEVQWDGSTVKAIVIKEESGSANLKDLVYISNYIGSAGVAAGRDKTSKPVYGYEAHFIGNSDYDKAVTIYSYKDLNRGDFARARLAAEAPTEVKNVTEENFYNLTRYGDVVDGRTTEKVHKALSVLPTAQIKDILSNNKTLLRLTNYDLPTKADTGIVTYAVKANERTDKDGVANITLPLNDVSELDLGDQSADSIVSINHAKFIDLTDNDVDSASDLKDLWNDVTDEQKAAHGKDVHRLINITLLFNDKFDDDGFRDVHAIVITSAPKARVYTVAAPAAKVDATLDLSTTFIGKNGATITGSIFDDKTVSIDTVEQFALKTKIATITFKVSAAGVISDVVITPVTGAETKVATVTIKTDAATNGVATLGEDGKTTYVKTADVTTQAVASATVGTDGKITNVKYTAADLTADKPLVLVDKAGNKIGEVTKDAAGAVKVVPATGTTIADDATISNGTKNEQLKPDGTVGEEVKTYAVTVTPNEKVTVTSEPATLTGLKADTKVLLTVAVKDDTKDEIVSVKAGETALTKNADGKYELTVTADVTVTIETQAKGTTSVTLTPVANKEGVAPEGVTATAVDGKLTVTGLDKNTRVVLADKDNNWLATVTEDGTVDFPADGKAYVQKADVVLDEDIFNETGIFVTKPEFDNTLVPGVLWQTSTQNAALPEITYVEEHIKYVTWKVSGKDYTVEQIKVTINGVAYDEAYRFCLKDTKEVGNVIKTDGVKAVSIPETEVPAKEGFVNFTAGKAVTIPVDDQGVPQVTVAKDATTGDVTITPKEGVTVKVGGKEYGPGEAATITADTPAVVEVPTIVAEVKVTIKADEANEGQYLITVEKSGKEPTDDELFKAINDEFKKMGVEIEVDGKIGNDVTANNKKVGTITASATYNVYVNDTVVGTIKTGGAEPEWKQTVRDAGTDLTLIDETKGNETNPTASTNGFGTLAWQGGTVPTITKELRLVNAYQLKYETSNDGAVASATYVDNNGADAKAESTKYFPEGASITVTGKLTKKNATKVTLTIGKDGTEKITLPAGDTAQTYTFKMGPTMLDKDKKAVTVAETATVETKVRIGSKVITTSDADVTDGFEIAAADMTGIEPGKYIQVTKDEEGAILAAKATTDFVTIAKDFDKDNNVILKVDDKVVTDKAYSEKDKFDILLLPAGAVAFGGTDLSYVISYNKDDVIVAAGEPADSKEETIYVPEGTTLQVMAKVEAGKPANYRVMETVGSATPTQLSEDKYATFTVPAYDTDTTKTPSISLMVGVAEVALKGTELTKAPEADTENKKSATEVAEAEVAKLVTVAPDSSFDVTAEAAEEKEGYKAGETGLQFTVTLKAKDGFYFTSTVKVGETNQTSADGKTVTFPLTVSIKAEGSGS